MATAPETKAWRCTVCGYVHHGEEPPDFCPLCGAGKEEFEPYEAPAVAAPTSETPDQWRCLNCNYAHEGAEPPEECPVCGAPADRFEGVSESATTEQATDARIRIIVAGGGIAGVSAAESARQLAPNAEITLISREAELPYYRLNLTRFLAGDVDPENLPIHDREWYAQQQIELRLGTDVAELDRDNKRVKLRNGDNLPYDRLILTMGAHPFMPPFPGAQREGVTTIRTVQDAKRVVEALDAGQRVICIGAGLLGIETAGALASRGGKVSLLESHDWLMPRQLDLRSGEILGEHLTRLGVELHVRARTDQLLGDERVAGVRLEDGRELEGDLVVISTGVRPNSYLARRAGLDVDRGLVVDHQLRTSDPDILAAGDLAEHMGQLYGAWGASQFQGVIAGRNAAGAGDMFGGLPRSNTLKVVNVPVVSVGQFKPEDGSFTVIEGEEDGVHRRFVFRDGCLVGAVLVGDAEAGAAARQAVEEYLDFSDLLQKHPEPEEILERLHSVQA